MSDQVTIALLTQLSLILTALATLIGVVANIVMSVKNGRKLAAQATTLAGQNVALATQATKSDSLLQASGTIHNLVNGASEEMRRTIAALRADLARSVAHGEQLRHTITSLNETIEALTRAQLHDGVVTNVRPV